MTQPEGIERVGKPVGGTMKLSELLLEAAVILEVQLRAIAVFVVIELVILAVNPLPDTDKEWETKKRSVIRHFCWCLALMITEFWLATL
jgi:hypothetical protein